MMIKYKYTLVAPLLLSLGLVSCNNDNAKISGSITGMTNEVIYLEQLSSSKQVLDSAKLSPKGEFDFKYKLKSDNPEFLNLRIGSDRIMLLVEKKDRVYISGLMNMTDSYKIEGSFESNLLQDLSKEIKSSYKEIDSLYKEYIKDSNSEKKDEILLEISKQYVKQKRNNINFICKNPNSLTSITALYQKYPNGVALFEDGKDLSYFRMIADSLKTKYPNSVYVKSLMKDIEQKSNQKRVTNMLLSSISSGNEIASPDIIMNDMYSKPQQLSSLRGKVVILSFWLATGKNNMLNKEYIEIYEAYKSKGLEIYQVSLDTSKQDWISAIITQKLPWISVCDFTGPNCIAAKTYNITSIPFNYILDREGNIVSKNIWGNDLIEKLKQIL